MLTGNTVKPARWAAQGAKADFRKPGTNHCRQETGCKSDTDHYNLNP
jgi:hypothetical protein